MKNINETIDRAFDAMIDEAAAIVNKEEGEKLVIPDIDVEFSEEHKKKMEKLFRKERQKYRLRTAVTYMPRVACIILIIVAVMAAQSFDGEAWRKKFMNFILDADAPNTKISFTEEKEDEIYGDMVEFGYMPKGFTLEESKISRKHIYLYFCCEDKYFQFKMNKADVDARLDTEDSEAESIKINGCEGVYIEMSDKYILIWYDGINTYRITANIEKKEIIKMAENIKIKG
jgi:hypothetical protein